jgi:hypothetical protein
MATTESIQSAYIDYVLTEGHEPQSVYLFAKKNEMTEEEFYRFFGSFEAVEQNIWTDLIRRTITEKFGRSIRHVKGLYRSSTAFLNY